MERAPLEVALSANELPDGVYRTHSPYRIDEFALSDGAIYRAVATTSSDPALPITSAIRSHSTSPVTSWGKRALTSS